MAAVKPKQNSKLYPPAWLQREVTDMKKMSIFSKTLTVLALSMAGAFAITQTEIQLDAEGQKVISLYGNYVDPNDSDNWITSYNDGVLTIPDELVCVLNQLWKPEFLNKGNLHVELNEKRCMGNEEGREAIQTVVNLSTDTSTGQTVGKIWYNDLGSNVYGNPRDVIVYLKVSVTASPTAAEPFGRFTIDAVDEDKNSGLLLSVIKVQAEGDKFKVTGRIPGNGVTFAGYSSHTTKQAIYNLNGVGDTNLSYNNDFVCYKNTGQNEDCFPRSLTAQDVYVNAWSYGIYNNDGSRYLDTVGDLNIDGNIYELAGNYGGVLRTKFVGNGPGNAMRGTGTASDAVFWSNKDALMTLNGQTKNMKVQWLTKTHSVPPTTAARLSAIPNNNGIAFTLSNSVLGDPTTLDPAAAKAIGVFPESDFSKPLTAKAGKIL